MKKLSVKKLALAGMLCALCVVGSVFSFPMFGSKCAPIQHMVNVTCAVLLGPWWGVGVAITQSCNGQTSVAGPVAPDGSRYPRPIASTQLPCPGHDTGQGADALRAQNEK